MNKHTVKAFLPIALLLVVELIIFSVNYKPGTFLVGWDNVMPEFNIWLNLKRSLFGVWQDYRGLGLVDGLSHTANLTHTLYIWLLSVVLPQSALRYVFLSLTHLIGGIALFYVAQKLTKNSQASFVAALFYMLNLGIIQLYFAPLEAFAIHFASLPIMTLCILNSISKPNAKNYLILFLASFLTSSQAFVPTLFITYFILVISILFFFVLRTKQVKIAVIILGIILASNAFWLIPYAYTVPKTAPIIQSTKINQIASEEVFYRNKARGDLVSTLMQKGFMIDTVEYSHLEDKDVFLMQIWRAHTDSIIYIGLYGIVFLCIIYGIVESIKTKNTTVFPFLATLLITFFFLANNTLGIDQLNSLIRTLFPTFGEVFRIPFTKFETLFSFCLSIFLGVGIAFLFKRISEQKLQIALACSFTAIILFLSFPVFLGFFTSPLLKVKIPNDYFEVMDYFSEKPSSDRIATLPLASFWNWQFRTWGQRGSGFLWYGIAQPMLERQFDPWSTYNEQFYNELSHAQTLQDKELFYAVLKKYNVSYLLLDETIKNVRSGSQPINYGQIKTFLNDLPNIEKQKQYGKLSVYKVNGIAGSVGIIKNPVKTSSSFLANQKDSLYQEKGDYIKSINATTSLLFPSLSTEKLQSNLEFNLEKKGSMTLFSPKQPLVKSDKPYTLTIPSLFEDEFLIPTQVELSGSTLILTFLQPKLFINGEEIPSNNEPTQIPINISGIKEIRFSELNQNMHVSSLPQKTYLFNKYPNVVEIVTDTGAYKFIIDTQQAQAQAQAQQFTIVPSKIENISIGIESFQSPLASDDILKEKYTIHKPTSLLYPYGKDVSFSEEKKIDNKVNLRARNNWIELSFYNGLLFHQASYLVNANTHYSSGLPINFYVDNPFQTRPELETVLSKSVSNNTLIIPPSEEVYRGYGFHFIVKSVGTEVAESTLDSISYFPIPLSTLQKIEINSQNNPVANDKIVSTPFHKESSFLYTASVEPKSKGYLVLQEAYDPNWKAYEMANGKWPIAYSFPFIFGSELKDHVLVNNWANGWKLNYPLDANNYTLVMVFWPQYLEFAGLILLSGTFTALIILVVKQQMEAKT